ncbi:uncharacterized protein LOC123307051 [Coccinella septempunctata]|uniref:uncharacterized protein LOC123307051 n=1 Tax=Coccinella septempunctata TaxID=41139 RepID=UPI001D094D6E|nr:uncharacterized protein LOC123307051 [Coccinella septempunctata]
MEDFINRIECSEISFAFKQLKYTLNKRHRNRQHIEFLHECKQHDVIPRFLNIRLPAVHNEAKKHRIRMSLLKKELRRQYQLSNNIDLRLKFLHHFLLRHLHTIEYSILVDSLVEDTFYINWNADRKRNQKLKFLINQKERTRQQTNRVHNAPPDIIQPNEVHQFHDRFTNLSDVDFSEEEETILNLGHKFAPIPKSFDIHEMAIDIELQIRSDPSFDTLADGVLHTLKCFREKRVKVSDREQIDINKKLRGSIKNIREKVSINDLIITKADKNAGLVILKKHLYIEKTLTFFNDNNILEIKNNPLIKFSNKVNNIIKTSLPTLHKFGETIFSIKERNPQTPKLYSLIKLHKPDRSIRPITSAIGSPTHKVSKFLNNWTPINDTF